MTMDDASQFRIKSKGWRVAHYIILLACAFMVLVPLYLVLNISLKDKAEFYGTLSWAPSQNIVLENYLAYFQKGNMLGGLWNYIVLLVPSIIISCLTCSMAAYIITRFPSRGTRLLMGAYLVASVIPTVTTSLPLFQVVKALGIYNTHLAGILLYSCGNVIEVYLFVQFMNTIPVSLDESAIVDGASYPYIFIRLILPLLLPAIGTAAIIKAQAIYNDFYVCMVFMPKTELATITRGLMLYVNSATSPDWNYTAAGIISVLLPITVVYCFTQKYIVSGLTSGSVKM